MQKKLIALALASLAGSAFAQSNVTIYGVADASFEGIKATGATGGNANNIAGQTRLSSNSSLLGFKGVEDLGNGLKAVWQFESGVDFTGNGDTSWNTTRDSFVGLAGNFGTVVAGTLTHPIRAMGSKVTYNPGGSSAAWVGAAYGEFLGVKTGTDDRAKNAVAYVSPNMSGFTVVGAYVSGGITGTNDVSADAKNSSQNGAGSYNSQQYQLAANYENGPLYVGLGYHYANNPRALAAVAGAVNAYLTASNQANVGLGADGYKDKLTDWRLAGKYTFSTGTSISALYDRQKYSFDDSGVLGSGNDAKRTSWMIGANQNFGKHNVYVEYAKAGSTKLNDDKLNQTGMHQWTLGYTYDLSKRTLVQAYYTELRNQKNVAYDNYVNGLNSAAQALNVGADTKVIGAGLRHNF